MAREKLVIATRGSELALWQSSHIKSLLEQRHHNLEIELRIIKTLGDKILDSPLSKIGDKGLFTKEIEHALLNGSADLAVHSLKDIPTVLPDGLTIAAVTKREDVRDVFVARRGTGLRSLKDLSPGAKVATGSLRRRCQLLQFNRDLRIIDIRGNLNTRLNKLDESDWDGMILAKAGLVRLGLDGRITEILPFETMLPAVGQGALAIETRSDAGSVRSLAAGLHDELTSVAVEGERAFLRHLEGGCQVPIGTFGRVANGEFILDAIIGSIDGTRMVRGSLRGEPQRASETGVKLAKDLLLRGGREILEEIRSNPSTIHPPAQP
ncbi:MAG TPA: hydroxymethylbilane synthase [Bacteroidota bacterium]